MVNKLELVADFYEFTMSNGYFLRNMNNKIAYFDVFFRKIPDNGGYVIVAGLEQVIEYVKNLKFTFYSYNKSKVASQVQDMLFTGNNYWLASRCVHTGSSSAYFDVRNVYSSNVYAYYLCYGYSSFLLEDAYSDYAVRPLVSLKSEVLDIDAGYNEATGGWKLK